MSLLAYLILRMTGTDEKQLQGAQVSHPLPRAPYCDLHEGLAQLREDAAVIQHSGAQTHTSMTLVQQKCASGHNVGLYSRGMFRSCSYLSRSSLATAMW